MDRLKKNSDFRRVYSRGRSHANRYLVLYYFPNELSHNRVGFSISKKIGKAVVRNKIRRRLKEIIRLTIAERMKKGYDLIFIARRPIIDLDYKGLEKNVFNIIKKAGIFM